MKALTDLIFTSDFFYSILRVTTPLLFASMGAVVSDVAGVPILPGGNDADGSLCRHVFQLPLWERMAGLAFAS